MQIISSEIWIIIIIATLIAVYYWFSAEERKYREKTNIIEHMPSKEWTNKPSSLQNKKFEQENFPSKYQPYIREYYENDFDFQRNKANKADHSYENRGIKLQAYSDQRKIDGKVDPILQSHSKIMYERTIPFSMNESQQYEPVMRNSMSTENFSIEKEDINQNIETRFHDNSKKNPYYNPYEEEKVYNNNLGSFSPKTNHNDKYANLSYEKLSYSGTMNVEKSPNSHEYLKSQPSSQSISKKPSKNDESQKQNKKSVSQIEVSKDQRKSANFRTSKYAEFDEDNTDVTFKQEIARKKTTRERNAEQDEERKYIEETFKARLVEESVIEYGRNSSLRKFVNNLSVKDHQYGVLSKVKDRQSIWTEKKNEVSKATQSINNIQSQPKESGGLFGNSATQASAGTASSNEQKNSSQTNQTSQAAPTSNSKGLFATNNTSAPTKTEPPKNDQPKSEPPKTDPAKSSNTATVTAPLQTAQATDNSQKLSQDQATKPNIVTAIGVNNQTSITSSITKPPEQKSEAKQAELEKKALFGSGNNQTSTGTSSLQLSQSSGGLFGNKTAETKPANTDVKSGLFNLGNSENKQTAPLLATNENGNKAGLFGPLSKNSQNTSSTTQDPKAVGEDKKNEAAPSTDTNKNGGLFGGIKNTTVGSLQSPPKVQKTEEKPRNDGGQNTIIGSQNLNPNPNPTPTSITSKLLGATQTNTEQEKAKTTSSIDKPTGTESQSFGGLFSAPKVQGGLFANVKNS